MPVSEALGKADFEGLEGGFGRGALGIYAKRCATPVVTGLAGGHNVEFIDHETGEFCSTSDVKDDAKRVERWALKSVVNEIMPASRTAKCLRWVIPGQRASVCKSVEHGKAFFSGLEVCSSVWVCPCCAAKISERRRSELACALKSAKDNGLSVYLLTLTVPHRDGDDLKGLLKGVQAAQTKLWRDMAGKKLIQRFGIVGRIRAFEVTHGSNGFHPHFHILLFTKSRVSVSEALNSFYEVWSGCCVKKGLGKPSRRHGVSFQDGSEAARYVGKWGLEHEMTKSHLKDAKGASMFDLLRRLLLDRDDAEAKRLFLVYAKAFKGQRQLSWTKGLKELLAVDFRDDDELATAVEDDAEIFAALSLEQWRAVVGCGGESSLLRCAEKTPDAFWFLVDWYVRLNKRKCGAGDAAAATPSRRGRRRSKRRRESC